MAGVDPITLAVVGAGVGAIANKDDPIKGAILGGAAGFTGGSMLGASTATAAGTTVGAGGIGGAGTGLTATTLGGGVPASAGLGTATGGVTGLTAAANPAAASFGGALGSTAPSVAGMGGGTGLLGTASMAGAANAPFAAAAGAPTMLKGASGMGMTPSQGLQAARLMSQPSGGTRTNVSPPQIRGGKAPTMVDPIQGLLASQMQRRRRQPMSLLG